MIPEGTPIRVPNAKPQQPLVPISHLGFDLASHEDVDAIAEEARKDGLLKFGPTFLNPHAGYLCIISDPDGHLVEFSYGQALRKSLTKRVPHKTFLGSLWEANFDVG